MAIDLDIHGNTKPLEASVQAAINRIRKKQIKIGIDDKGITQPLGNMKRSADEFSKSMEAANARILAFGASMAIINGVANAFKGMVSSLVEVEKSLADINVVMGLSAQNLDKFSDGLFKAAKETGAAFNVAAQAATEYARQGLGVEESLKRTRDALILTRLTGMDSAEAVKSLTAAMNTYGNQIKDTTQLVSKFAAVDVQFAVSAEDFADAMSRAGQSAYEAGVSVDEFIGIITAAQQKTARGGAVIGNALKTILTKVGKPEALNQLENLGIAVRDVEGDVISAKQILSDLANTFDDLSQSQKSQITQTIGGLFHINILKAVLSDAAKENGILARATEISADATNEAIEKNEQLRDTLSALTAETGLALKEMGSKVAEITIGPGLEKVLNTVKSLAEGASNLLGDGESIGGKFANGLLKGIGNVLTGPGLIVITAVFGKLFITAAKFAAESLRSLIGITGEAQKQKAIQTSIVTLLTQNAALGKEMLRTDLSRVQKEQLLLGLLQAQTAEAARLDAISKRLATSLYTRGYGPSLTKVRAEGHIPNFAHPEREKAAQGGYAAGTIRSLKMPGEGSVIYNSAEKVKKFKGFTQPAIMPPQSSVAGKNYQRAFGGIHGFDPYAAEGYIPNFARIKLRPKTRLTIRDGKLIEDSKEKTTVSKPSDLKKGVVASQQKRQAKISGDILNLNAALPGAKNLGVLLGEGPEGPLRPVTYVQSYNSMKGNARNKFQKLIKGRGKKPEGMKAQVTLPTKSLYPISGQDVKDAKRGVPGVQQHMINYLGDSFDDFSTSIRHKLFGKRSGRGEQGALQKHFVGSAVGNLLEAGIKGALNKKVPDGQKGNDAFDFIANQAKSLSGFMGRNLTAIELKYKESTSLGSSGKLPLKVLNFLAGAGYIPNFADPLSDAIGREKAAGVPVSQIRVGSHGALMSRDNPLGLGVTNTYDEPNGLRDVFGANGYVPNYFMGIVSKAGQAISKKAKSAGGKAKDIYKKTTPTLYKHHRAMEQKRKKGDIGDSMMTSTALGISSGFVHPDVEQGEYMSGGDMALSAAGTALEYGSIGAMIGSAVPFVGTALGALAGAALGFGKGLWDASDRNKEISEQKDEAAKKAIEAIKENAKQQEEEAKAVQKALILRLNLQNVLVKSAGEQARHLVHLKAAHSREIQQIDFELKLKGSAITEQDRINAQYQKSMKKASAAFEEQAQKTESEYQKGAINKLSSQDNNAVLQAVKRYLYGEEGAKNIGDQDLTNSLSKKSGKDLRTMFAAIAESNPALAAQIKEFESLNIAREEGLKTAQAQKDEEEKTAAVLKEQNETVNRMNLSINRMYQTEKRITKEKEFQLQKSAMQKEILSAQYSGQEYMVAGRMFELEQSSSVDTLKIQQRKDRAAQSKNLGINDPYIQQEYIKGNKRLLEHEMLKTKYTDENYSKMREGLELLNDQKKAMDLLISKNEVLSAIKMQQLSVEEKLRDIAFEDKMRGYRSQSANLQLSMKQSSDRLALGAGYISDYEREKFEIRQSQEGLPQRQEEISKDFDKQISELKARRLAEEENQQRYMSLKNNFFDKGLMYGHNATASEAQRTDFTALDAGRVEREKEISKLKQEEAALEKLKQENLESEEKNISDRLKQLEQERAHKTGPGAFGRGMDDSFERMREEAEFMSYQLGDQLPYDFADGLSNALVQASKGAESLGDALTNAAMSFLSIMQQAMMKQAVYGILGSMGMKFASRGGSVKKYSRGGGVPAMVSNGEYVMSREAVSKYGGSFMHNLNARGKVKKLSGGGDPGSALSENFGGGGGYKSGHLYQGKAMSSFFYSGRAGNQALEADGREMAKILEEERRAEEAKKAKKAWKKAQRKALIGQALGTLVSFGMGKLANSMPKSAASGLANQGSDFLKGGAKSPLMEKNVFGNYKYSIPSESFDLAPKSWSELPSYGTQPLSSNLDNFLKRKSRGGYISGTPGIDQIPAMLSEGEYVIKASSARQIGKPMLDLINAGKFNDGGAVGDVSQTQESTTASSNTNNINITVNVDGSGTKDESSQSSGQQSSDAAQKEKQGQELMAQKIKGKVIEVILEEKRPGGILSGSG